MKTNTARICVPVCVSRADELAAAIQRAEHVSEVVELRLDYLSERELANSSEAISSVIASRKQPMIVTLRPAEYGGTRAINQQDRLLFRYNCPSLGDDGQPEVLCDLELDLALLLQQRQKEGNDVVAWGLCDWKRTICSQHDFVGVPSDVEQLYERMSATPARILKIAVQADDAIDCLTVFHLLERAQREDREMIAIAMGQAGIMTRILGPSRGSFLTYGSLDDESATASGQLTARELRDVYRVDHINQDTQIVGIIGQPVSHSLSPRIHNAAFAAEDMNAVYIPFEVRDVASFMRRMARPRSREIDWNLRGLSVTAPHKLAVMAELDWIDDDAKNVGAVNTIVAQDGQLRGYNTDANGFILPLREQFGSLAGARCAIIGAGGAARAALWALRRARAEVAIFARDLQKADAALKKFGVNSQAIGNASLKGFDLVVNATPVGMRGHEEEETTATGDQLRGVQLAYDLVYNPTETRFLREARAAGCETLSGLEMLIAQGVEQFKLWTEKQPDVSVMRAAAVAAIG